MSLFDQKMKSGFCKLCNVAGETREFAVADGKGGERVFTARVIWAQDAMKRDSVANSHGVYLADVQCTFNQCDLPRIPTEGEYIESPRYIKYDIVDVTVGSGVITLSLLKKTTKGVRQ
jgi:hypothetical protein